jgi:hypothetical protein
LAAEPPATPTEALVVVVAIAIAALVIAGSPRFRAYARRFLTRHT